VPTEVVQRLREPETSRHVGPRVEVPPKLASQFLEPFGSNGAHTGGHSLITLERPVASASRLFKTSRTAVISSTTLTDVDILVRGPQEHREARDRGLRHEPVDPPSPFDYFKPNSSNAVSANSGVAILPSGGSAK
jgi:hypothetical protein